MSPVSTTAYENIIGAVGTNISITHYDVRLALADTSQRVSYQPVRKLLLR